jgi:L-aspartate oxidase
MKYDDVLIIGSGVAALQLALQLSNEKNVRILTKSTISASNSYLAQGGIAAAIGPADDPKKHYEDTMEAGRFHNNQDIVKKIIYEAPALIQELARKGQVFDCDTNGKLLLGMEGAHSESRIVHAGGDATGKNVSEYLINSLGSNVTVNEHVFAYELVIENDRCIGVKTKHSDGTIHFYRGSHIVIAAGGCGQLYRYTSTADTVCGDGIALAYRAGAEIVDMEFIQFHPTLLYINGETKGLISEAVRGEGGILVTRDGTAIMEGVHPFRDLAPRHIVSQTIYDYLRKGNEVFLDISRVANFKKRFPSITMLCEENGVDLEKGKIPVVPGSHFLMGGVKTDLIGRTSIPGLYAIGETACTGLHGANRLASNSLLEGLYQGKKLAQWLNSAKLSFYGQLLPQSNNLASSTSIDLPSVQQIQESMMERVGIVRNEVDLIAQIEWLSQFTLEPGARLDYFSISQLTRFFMVVTAQLITESALKRAESRGGHFRSDYPEENDPTWLNRLIIHNNPREREKRHEHAEIALTT